jgi:hypothetical protein
MRAVRGVVLTLLLLPFGGMLAGCDSLDTFQIFDSKKKLPGVREPVFPNGVPGVTQGIPPDLVKGYQEPQQATVDPAAAAAQATAEKIEPKAEPKPKPKPKPRKVAQPAAAQQPQQPQQAQAPWPGQQQPQQPQQAPGWPTAR